MAKYSFEFKKKVVMSYLNGRDGYQSVAKQYGIASHNQVKKWVLSYQRHGMKDCCVLVNRKNILLNINFVW